MNKKLFIIGLLCLSLVACATQTPHGKPMSFSQQSYLAKGKDYFHEGRFKSAMRLLLPLASDGISEAEYAVGYMYYNGFGVSQDEEVGTFWIERAAKQQFAPAIKALQVIKQQQRKANKKYAHKKHLKKVSMNHELHNLNLDTSGERFQNLASLRKKLTLSFHQPLA